MHRRLIKSFLVALAMAIAGGLFGGGHSAVLAQQHTGTDFWVAFPGNSTGADTLQLNIVGTGAATVTVDYAPTGCVIPGFPLTTAVASGVLQTVSLPALASGACSADLQTPGVEHKGIHVVATGSPITVYGFSSAPAASTDGFLALPVDAVGSRYYTVSHPGQDSSSASQFVVVATHDATTVTITPAANLASGEVAGTPFTVSLPNKGDTYLGRTAVGAAACTSSPSFANCADLTGSLITADHAIAVFSGDRCSNVPIDKLSCDTTLEQLPPVDAWGRTFVTAPHLTPGSSSTPFGPLATRVNGDRFRIVASQNGTAVSVNGTNVPGTLAAGQAVDVADVGNVQKIAADKPILVTQFEQSQGNDPAAFGFDDPSMTLVTPYEQWLADYRVTTPVSVSSVTVNFVNLVAPATAVPSIALDGLTVSNFAVWTAGPAGFQITRFPLNPGSHRLSGAQPFGVTMYGTGVATSYSYPGGMSTASVATVQALVIEVGGALYVGDVRQVRARALDAASGGNPVANVRVDFSASANTAVSSGVNFRTTGSDGWTPYFSYTGTALVASETVTASVGVAPNAVQNSATAQWKYAIAANDVATTPVNTPVTIDVLANDFNSDPGGPPVLAISSYFNQYPAAAISGTVVIGPSGSNITYTPKPGFTGTVVFNYAMSHLLKNDYTQAVVAVGVGGAATIINRPPVAIDDSFNPTEHTAAGPLATLTGSVSSDNGGGADHDDDGDPMTFVIEGPGPQHGILLGGLNANGTFVYRPDLNSHGTDTFKYKAFDGVAYSNVATVTLAITGNQAPTATPNEYFTLPGMPVAGNVIRDDTGNGKDSDPEGDFLHAALVTPPASGVLSLGANGRFTYQPVNTGTFTFSYKVSDAQSGALPAAAECDPRNPANGCILDAAAKNQLTQWIGTGPLQFDLLFSKRGGDGQTAADYHAAVDNVPRTVTIIRAKDDLPNPSAQTEIFGGYNPGVFDSSTDTVPPGGLTMPDDARTAFVFNLSRPTTAVDRLMRQRLSSNPCTLPVDSDPDCGNTQIWNLGPLSGPAWGDAWDLAIGCNLAGTCKPSDLNPLDLTPSNLEVVSAAASSYGTAGTGAFWTGPDDRTSVIVSPAAAHVDAWGCSQTAECGQFSMSAADSGFEVYAVRPFFAGTGLESAPATVTIHVVGAGMSLAGGTFSYDGRPHPAICAMTASDGASLTVDVTYAPGLNAPTAAGTYTATCTFDGDDAGHPAATQTATVTISKAQPAALTFAITGAGTYDFDGNNHGITCTVTSPDGTPLPYAIGYPDGIPHAVGTYRASCDFKGDDNHERASQLVLVVIRERTLSPVTIYIRGDSFTYDGMDHQIACTATSAGGMTLLPVSIGYTGGTPHNAGTYVATCTYYGDDTNARADRSVVVKVNPRALTVTAPAQRKNYGSGDPTLTYALTSGALVDGGFSGELSREAGENVGPHPIQPGTLTAGPNYAITVVGGNLTIDPAPITVTADAQSKVYGTADDPTLTYRVTSGRLFFQDGFTGGLIRVAGTNVGSYAIQQGSLTTRPDSSIPDNYTLTFNGANLDITKAPVHVVVSGGPLPYNGSAQSATCSVTGPNASGSTISLPAGTLTYNAPPVAANTYTATCTSAGDTNHFGGTGSAPFTISPKGLTITAASRTKTYGQSVTFAGTEFTTSGLVGGDSVGSVTLTSAGEGPGATVGGSPYAITPSAASGVGLGNYTITYANGGLTVDRASIAVKADAKTKVYGDADPPLTYQVTSGALVNGDGFSGDLMRAAGTDIGPYAIQQGSLTAGNNYNLTFAGANLTIGTRPIGVTADAKSKMYGEVDPALTYQVTSGALIAGDHFSGSLTRVAGAHFGSYAIQQGTLTAGNNYTLSFGGANLSITPAPLTVRADDKVMSYGAAALPPLTVTYSGWLNGDTPASLATQPSLSTTATASSPVGTYPITASGASDPDYTISYVPGTLTIVSSATFSSISAPAITYAADAVVTVTVLSPAGTVVGNVTLTADGGAPQIKPLVAGSATFALARPGAGDHVLSVSYPAQGFFTASRASGTLHVTMSPTSTTFTTGSNPSSQGQAITLTAKVSAVAPGSGVPVGSVTFKDGTTVLATVAVNADGRAVFTTSTLALGPHTLTATYSGNGNYLGSSASADQLVFAYPAGTGGGTFVIGDLNAIVGAPVTFWGSQWEKDNSLGGGSSPSSFKGFANAPNPNPVRVGGVWQASPGNSGQPPSSVPSYLGVIVASADSKSGSTISGNVVAIAVVRTNAGYAGDPGRAGTGTVVAVIR